MMRMMWSIALVVAVVPVAAGAQFGAGKGKKGDKAKTREWTVTGCVETGSAANTFVLTHVTADSAQMGKRAAKKGAVAPHTLALTGEAVDLRTHVGHKVSVTGSVGRRQAGTQGTTAKDAPKVTVKSLKMIATTCS